MPKYDGTGPTGKGPKTGRGFGTCCGLAPCVTPLCGMGWGMGRGRGFGRGRGMGLGFFNCPYCGCGQPQTKKDQLEALSEYKKILKEELEEIENQEKDLDKDK